MITSAIEKILGTFRIADIQRECPGVSVDMIRQVLKKLRKNGLVECLGRGAECQMAAKDKGK
jgi:DNA-binding HxlR family transcriptional regulator